MRDLIGLHLQRVEWDKEGFVARVYPFTRSRRSPAEESSQPRVVTMDPRVEFGRPVLKVSAVAKTTDRSQLQNLLTYCRLNKGRVHFVVVFNLTRFARDKYDHFALRSHLQSLGISLRSATEPIDDTSTGKLMEGVLAAFAQFDTTVGQTGRAPA
jgi:hypothetical protein